MEETSTHEGDRGAARPVDAGAEARLPGAGGAARLVDTDARRLRECILAGGVAVFPADTVYGLACDPTNRDAVARLYELKGRPPERPAAVMFFSLHAALAALPELGEREQAALRALLPGPFTLLLPNRDDRYPLACRPTAARPGAVGEPGATDSRRVAEDDSGRVAETDCPRMAEGDSLRAAGGDSLRMAEGDSLRAAGGDSPRVADNALGLRVPLLPERLAALGAVDVPAMQSSANLSGGPDARSLAEVPQPLRRGADLVLDGGPLPGVASTVLDLRHYAAAGRWRIVRAGPVGEDRLAQALGETAP